MIGHDLYTTQARMIGQDLYTTQARMIGQDLYTTQARMIGQDLYKEARMIGRCFRTERSQSKRGPNMSWHVIAKNSVRESSLFNGYTAPSRVATAIPASTAPECPIQLHQDPPYQMPPAPYAPSR